MVKLGLVKRECVATSIHITVRCTAANNGITVNFNDLLTTAFAATATNTFDIINVTLPNNQQAAFQQAYNNLNLGINAVLNFIDSDNTNEVKVEFIQIDNTVGDVDD